MYNLHDTIVAISSPPGGTRAIVRITGDATIALSERIFDGKIPKEKSGVSSGSVTIDRQLPLDAQLYLFRSPNSYTGEDIAEIHLHANPAVLDKLMGDLLGIGLRMAGPGEFTARAYLNGKIDLSQAEAVNEIVSSSNTFQLAAAEKLLSGRLSESAEAIRSEIVDCLSLIEAALDFSGEDIEFISGQETLQKLREIKNQLEDLLAGSIGYESLIDLPAVGIAGAPNAGKSSLVNTLLGSERSIVSSEPKTTRDVLTGILELDHCKCVLFDCAGLLAEPEGILDDLAQAAAIEALRNCSVVLLCVDASNHDWAEDIAVRKWIDASILIPVATKSDLLEEDTLAKRIATLQGLFSLEFTPISTATGRGIQHLRKAIDKELGEPIQPQPIPFSEETAPGVALTARHRQAVTEAIENIDQAIDEFQPDATELTTVMLRAAHQAVSAIEQPHCIEVDEQILDQIFSTFCIGK